MEKEKRKKEEGIGTEEAFRSLGRFLSWVEARVSPGTEFREHMAKSKMEFLKGIRSLIDKRIDEFEKRHTRKTGKRATRVKVD